MSHPSFGLYELYNVCMLIEWCLCMWERWVFYPCESGMTPFWGPCRCQRGIVLAWPNNSKQCTKWRYRVIKFLFCLWKIYFFIEQRHLGGFIEIATICSKLRQSKSIQNCVATCHFFIHKIFYIVSCFTYPKIAFDINLVAIMLIT